MYKIIIFTIFVSQFLGSCDSKLSADEDYLITISTDKGDMKVILYDETPVHKENFIKLAKSGEYDKTRWHRVIKNFMIQGGNIYESAGNQEPESGRLPAEIIPGMMHTKGALAAARMADQINPERKSSSSQFYIVHGRKFSEDELTIDQFNLNIELSKMFETEAYDSLKSKFIDLQQAGGSMEDFNALALSMVEYVEKEKNISLRNTISPERLAAYTSQGGAPHLDNQYTVFGRVVEGLDVIDLIANVETGTNDEPVSRIGMKMKLEVVKKSWITENYGYQYPNQK